MFSCSACFRRAINALLTDLPLEPLNQARAVSRDSSRNHHAQPVKRHHSTFRPTVLEPKSAQHGKRNHSTVSSLRKGHHLRVLRETLKKNEPVPLGLREIRKGPSAVARRDASARRRNKSVYLSDEPPSDQVPRSGPAHEKYVAQFLKDPLKLAQTVLERLRMKDVTGALSAVKASDREKVENGVSWNHIMDYEMNYHNVKGAMKVYNEMKKRGHKPDAHTYTIMLRGFTANVKEPQAVENALNIYNSMFAPNSAVTPNIIHTNAVINVCARGKAMDALWSVAGRLPEKGPGAPDKWTFTTILNALASNAQTRASALQQALSSEDRDDHVRKVFDEAVVDGRKLWGDVVERWRKGDLVVDQPLVCAMGRLLLLGSRWSGWEDVFGLVEQTMRIPRWTPAGEDQKTLPPPESEFQPVDIPFPNTEGSGKAGMGHSGEAGAGPGEVGASNTSVYARPGNNALSMLIQAAIMTKNVRAGKMYWDLLTDANGPYQLKPDAANLALYLRLLRISRSSKVVVDLLRSELLSQNETLAQEFFRRGTLVISMSTCVRDKNNPNAFEHASRVMDVMQERLGPSGGMDPRIMDMYVNLAVLTTPGLGSASPWREMEFEKDAAKNHAMRALKRLGPDVVNVKNLMKQRVLEEEFRDRPGKRRDEEKQTGPSVDDLATFLRSMVGAYDRLLTKGAEAGVERGLLEEWLGQKRKLSAFVTKMVGGVRYTSGRGVGGEADGEAEEDEEGVEPKEIADMKDKRWERNPVPQRKGPLSKAEQRVERVKRDFPRPRKILRTYGRRDKIPEGRLSSMSSKQERKDKNFQHETERRERFKDEFPSAQDVQQRQQIQQIQREGGVVVKGWGTAFDEMERDQRGRGQGTSRGMAL